MRDETILGLKTEESPVSLGIYIGNSLTANENRIVQTGNRFVKLDGEGGPMAAEWTGMSERLRVPNSFDTRDTTLVSVPSLELVAEVRIGRQMVNR